MKSLKTKFSVVFVIAVVLSWGLEPNALPAADLQARLDQDRAEGARCGAEQAPAASASAQLAARGHHTKLGLRAAT